MTCKYVVLILLKLSTVFYCFECFLHLSLVFHDFWTLPVACTSYISGSSLFIILIFWLLLLCPLIFASPVLNGGDLDGWAPPLTTSVGRQICRYISNLHPEVKSYLTAVSWTFVHQNWILYSRKLIF